MKIKTRVHQLVLAYLPLMLLLGSCTESTPVSPPHDTQNEPVLTSRASRGIAVDVHDKARLMRLPNGQQFVEIRVRARCPVGYEQSEEPLTLTQRHGAFGQGGFGMICTGQWERRTFRVFAQEIEFRRGRASFSVAFVVDNPETGEQLRATDSGKIRLR